MSTSMPMCWNGGRRKEEENNSSKLDTPKIIEMPDNNLVGSIVERNTTATATAPLPSLLPFPVARHRSHAPHWTPHFTTADDDEDEPDFDYSPFADFAKPIPKKTKKPLDFTNSRHSLPHSHSHSNVSTTPPNPNSHSPIIPHHNTNTIHTDPSVHFDFNKHKPALHTPQQLPPQAVRDDYASATVEPHGIAYDQGQMTLETQIDAENRALIHSMSPEDLAQAQAEITNRINPQLLEVLKRRGLHKLNKHTNSATASPSAPATASADIQAAQSIPTGDDQSPVSPTDLSPPAITITPGANDTHKSPGEGVVTNNSSSPGGRLWDAWSKRVEAVRDLRFSLDGNVLQGSSLGQTYTADNVAERDFLRTEGDPAAAGYTIKETLALTRSIVPGQRTLALHLLASVLRKVLQHICESQLDFTTRASNENSVDWHAIWAYALGPEPELVLSLRLTLDDNHGSVVLASAKAIECILACDLNEKFFDRLEKMEAKELYTAPVFRSRPDVKLGFLGGGFWKYSTKPAHILLPDEVILNDEAEGEHTIQDDIVVAGQDVAAGFVRMGLLSRLRYILETDPTVALEECVLSILVAIARHSPACANAIWKCERLVQTIVDRFTMKDTPELQASKIRSVTILRVIAQSSKTICTEFINKGFFQTMTWQLYRMTSSIDEWVKCGRDSCKLASKLMIEQLRFWKVCVMYGQCISYFSGFFPALCLWLSPPTFDKLMEKNVFHEFASISKEVYLVLDALARRLPDLYPSGRYGENTETWCWNDVGPMVDAGLSWMKLINGSTFSEFIYPEGVESTPMYHNAHISSFLWTTSAVMHMLDTVLVKAKLGDALELKGGSKNGLRLPDLLTKIVRQIVEIVVPNFSDQSKDRNSTEPCGMTFFIEKLCFIRQLSDSEASLASVWCLHGLFRVIVSIDSLIQLIRNQAGNLCFQGYEFDTKVLENDILKCSMAHWRTVISEFVKLVSSEWHFVHSIEAFGRGGPAPGTGVGWGGSGGGFWSLAVTLAQADANLLIELLETFHTMPAIDLWVAEDTFLTKSINAALAMSVVVTPGNKVTLNRVFDVLLQIPVLRYLGQCIFRFLHGGKLFKWEYKEGDLIQFSKILALHFKIRWLSTKKKKLQAKVGSGSGKRTVSKGGHALDTIHEDVEMLSVNCEDNNSLTIEWTHQRLPLPSQWLLSPLASINDITSSYMPNTSAGAPLEHEPMHSSEVAKAGLFFLLGIEAMSSKLPQEDNCLVGRIPLIWKLHSLSVALLGGMAVLEEERSRNLFEALHSLYGQHLDELRFNGKKTAAHKHRTVAKTDISVVDHLRFKSEIHENYSTFVETLVEQYAAISYGDIVYGRQIAIYLHMHVEAPVRLATWNALSNARVLELLPPLDNCVSHAEGYLDPVEEDDSILEAYVKSWVSGSLDRAATRSSMAYNIVIHHVSSFIFDKYCEGRLLLRNKLVKSLLRDYSRKRQHEVMMLDFVCYKYNYNPEIQKNEQSASDYIVQRFNVLKEACEGNSQLLTVVDKLNLSFQRRSN